MLFLLLPLLLTIQDPPMQGKPWPINKSTNPDIIITDLPNVPFEQIKPIKIKKHKKHKQHK